MHSPLLHQVKSRNGTATICVVHPSHITVVLLHTFWTRYVCTAPIFIFSFHCGSRCLISYCIDEVHLLLVLPCKALDISHNTRLGFSSHQIDLFQLLWKIGPVCSGCCNHARFPLKQCLSERNRAEKVVEIQVVSLIKKRFSKL